MYRAVLCTCPCLGNKTNIWRLREGHGQLQHLIAFMKGMKMFVTSSIIHKIVDCGINVQALNTDITEH